MTYTDAQLASMAHVHDGETDYRRRHYIIYNADGRLVTQCPCPVPREEKHVLTELTGPCAPAPDSPPATTRSAPSAPEFEALGKSGVNDIGGKLDTFPKPGDLTTVRLVSDEVTAVCPITGQPDWYTVCIEYDPRELCAESKSVKLLFNGYRNRGLFGEALAVEVANTFMRYVDPVALHVEVTQKSRGGITITSTVFRGVKQ